MEPFFEYLQKLWKQLCQKHGFFTIGIERIDNGGVTCITKEDIYTRYLSGWGAGRTHRWSSIIWHRLVGNIRSCPVKFLVSSGAYVPSCIRYKKASGYWCRMEPEEKLEPVDWSITLNREHQNNIL